MPRLLRFAGILFALSIPASARSQDAEQHPSGLAWKVVDTPHFQIIAPLELVSQAQRVGNLLERARIPVARTLSVEVPRTQLLLGNQTTQANAGVNPFLRYSEWYSTPPQTLFSGPAEWYATLAVHEFRHVAQAEKLNTGFNRVLGAVAGRAVGGILPYLVVPGWYFEGDATGAETAFTSAGRGRLPSFDMRMRTELLAGRRRSYHEALHGSYRTWSPTEYELGYLVTTHIKRRYGAEALDRVVTRSARRAYNPEAFSSSLRAVTGKGVVEIYEETLQELDSLWRRQAAGLQLTEGRVLNGARLRGWANYQHAQYLGDGSVVALKDGLSERPHLVHIRRDGRETELAGLRLNGADARFSAAGDQVIWSEPVPDARWGKRDFTRIRSLDVRSNRVRSLTRQGKWFAPALSPDGRRVAAVEFTTGRRSSIVVLDARTGAELARFAAAPEEVQLTPAWAGDGLSIVLLRQTREGVGVAQMDVATGRVRELIASSAEPITHPVLHGEYLFFNSPRSGIDNVYALHLASGKQFQVTSRKYGAFNASPSPAGDRIVFQDYTPDGFDAVETALDPASWTPAERVEDRSIRYVQPLVEQEGGKDLFADVPEVVYPVREWRGARDLIRPYLHLPIPGPTPAVQLGSTNMMNTLDLTADIGLDLTDGTSRGEIAASYMGWYPIVDVRLGDQERESTYAGEEGAEQTDEWRERALGIGLRLPLDLSRGEYAQRLSLGVRGDAVRVSGRERTPSLRQGNGTLLPLTYFATFSRLRVRAPRDLMAAGQTASLAFRHTPGPGDYQGAQLAARGSLVRPGLSRHHAVRVTAGYERQDPDNYRFSSIVRLPRGYGQVFHPDLRSASLDYVLPLAYPDIRVGPFTTVKRLAGTLFLDHAQGRGAGPRASYTSAGGELTAEAALLSLPFTIIAGARLAYLFGGAGAVVRPIIGGSFTP